MSLVRVAAPELLRSVDVNDLALNTTLYYAAGLSYTALDIGLSSALFGASSRHQIHRFHGRIAYALPGVLTLLVIQAIMFLTYGLVVFAGISSYLQSSHFSFLA